MDGSTRTAAYQMTKSGEGEDVRVGSPLQKGHLVCWFHSEFHLRSQQRPFDEGIHQLMSPCFLCWIVKVSQEERGPARAMPDARNCQI